MRTSGHRLLLLTCLVAMCAGAPAALAQSVTCSPATTTVIVGSQIQLTATVSGLPNRDVVWSAGGSIGGNSIYGTVSPSGLFTAPAVPPDGFSANVRARSASNPTVAGKCVITIRHRTPKIEGVSPARPVVGPFTLQIAGRRFVPGAQVRWNGTPLATTFVSQFALTATGVATQAGSVTLTVVNPGPGAVSVPWTLSVDPAPTPTRTRTLPPTATRTSSPTRTRPPATATGTSTRTPTRSTTPTRTSTRMPTASATLAMTATPMQTATATMVRTATATMMPTATLGMTTPSMMPSGTRTEAPRSATPTATAAGSPPPTAPLDPQTISRGRLLDQMTFGRTAQLDARLAQLGPVEFIEEQLAMPESPWPALAGVDRSAVLEAFFNNALAGQDQLRQRVIYALGEIIVVATNKNTNADEILPWLQLLSRNAFGNYRTLLREISIDASMGKYLDLANSGFSGAPNENYPRELMQLFSIGLHQLNLDGSVKVDAQGVPLPTYTQADVAGVAKALTGWTYGNPSGTPPAWMNSNYYPGPMLPVAAYHNQSAKTFLGQTLPAGRSAQEDLEATIDVIFNHPNVGPFIATRLIRALVTSNPSPAYIARVATAFNGSGARGDMKAVLRAILLDPEARNDTPPANFGRLRTPMQHTIALARALGLNLGSVTQFAYLFSNMNESLLDAPSVFGHYSPMYRIPLTGLFGPEFQIYSASDAINRANMFWYFLYQWPMNPVLQPFVALANDPVALVNAVDNTMLYGRMAPATRAALLAAMPAMPDNNARVMTAVYLTSMSGEMLVQR